MLPILTSYHRSLASVDAPPSVSLERARAETEALHLECDVAALRHQLDSIHRETEEASRRHAMRTSVMRRCLEHQRTDELFPELNLQSSGEEIRRLYRNPKKPPMRFVLASPWRVDGSNAAVQTPSSARDACIDYDDAYGREVLRMRELARHDTEAAEQRQRGALQNVESSERHLLETLLRWELAETSSRRDIVRLESQTATRLRHQRHADMISIETARIRADEASSRPSSSATLSARRVGAALAAASSVVATDHEKHLVLAEASALYRQVQSERLDTWCRRESDAAASRNRKAEQLAQHRREAETLRRSIEEARFEDNARRVTRATTIGMENRLELLERWIEAESGDV